MWPLTRAARFEAMGMRPPSGVLRTGPPGSGDLFYYTKPQIFTFLLHKTGDIYFTTPQIWPLTRAARFEAMGVLSDSRKASLFSDSRKQCPRIAGRNADLAADAGGAPHIVSL